MATDYARESLHLVVDTSRSEPRLARQQDAIVAVRRLILTVLGKAGRS